MKKGAMVAIGVGIAIAIAVILGFTAKTEKETATLNSTIGTPVSSPTTQTLPTTPPIIKGKNFSVTLSETVASSAH
ncbi:MAG TPA: hypothetical protein VEJ68_02405 [Candidatus Bathyarchaeia archaeon]|nr:hypothetical protein [Candidatus Bathyarchaeia archaeon]